MRTLVEIAAALRGGNESAESLYRGAENNHENFGQLLNAYKHWDGNQALERSKKADAALAAGDDKGPLLGMPIAIKDIYGVPGQPIFAGSANQLPAKWERAGPIVQEIEHQLGNIVGKTHTVEFALGGLGDNEHWGAPRNPWDDKKHRSPGGSSSGAAVSLWEGSALVAFGSDTMGSVRIPAAMNGLVGLKVTYERWSNEGIVPLLANVDTPGPLVRSVADAAFVFAALDPAHQHNPKEFLGQLDRVQISDLTIGIADKCLWQDCDPGIVESVQKSIAELEKAGATIIDAPSPEIAALLPVVMAGGIHYSEFVAFLEAELPAWKDRLGLSLQARMEKARALTAPEYIATNMWLNGLVESATDNFSNIDVMISPTVPITPPVLIDGVPEADAVGRSPVINARNTSPVNLLRQCAVTLPVGLDSEQMPVGLQVIAPGGREEKLLQAACAMENVLGTGDKRLGVPPVLRD